MFWRKKADQAVQDAAMQKIVNEADERSLRAAQLKLARSQGRLSKALEEAITVLSENLEGKING